MDTSALIDARNLVDSVINATLGEESVDYTKLANSGSVVGDKDADGNPRSPVFILSPGVEAVIIGDSRQPPNGTTYFEAHVYHTNGTADGLTVSNRKEYICIVDESAGLISLP